MILKLLIELNKLLLLFSSLMIYFFIFFGVGELCCLFNNCVFVIYIIFRDNYVFIIEYSYLSISKGIIDIFVMIDYEELGEWILFD